MVAVFRAIFHTAKKNIPIPAPKATIRRKIDLLKNFYKSEYTPPSDPRGQMVAFGMKTKDFDPEREVSLGRDTELPNLPKNWSPSLFASSI